MIVSDGATTALALIAGLHSSSDATASTTSASTLLTPASAQGQSQMEQYTAYREKVSAWMAGLEDGSIAPNDKGPGAFGGVTTPGQPQGAGKVPAGAFVASKAPSEGGELVVRDAAHPDRQAAVMNAYHYATVVIEQAEKITRHEEALLRGEEQSQAYQRQIDTRQGDAYDPVKGLQMVESGTAYARAEIAEAKLDVERATTSLAKMFSFTETTLSQNGDGTSSLAGFTISHGDYGKIMEVSAEGEITMFDQSGKTYTREEYVSAQPDGLIGEMHNDLIDESNEVKVQQEINTMTQGRSATTIDLSDLTKFDIRL